MVSATMEENLEKKFGKFNIFSLVFFLRSFSHFLQNKLINFHDIYFFSIKICKTVYEKNYSFFISLSIAPTKIRFQS